MTIETGPAQTISRPAAPEPKHANGKPGEAQGQGTGGAGGFMSILASLDTSELVVPTAGTLADGVLPGKGAASAALAALARAAGYKDTVAAEDDRGKILSTSGADLAATLPVSVDANLVTDAPLDTPALLAQAAQWSIAPTIKIEQGNPNAAAELATKLAGAAKLHAVAKPGGSVVSSDAAGDSVADWAGKVGKAQKDAFARLASSQAALSAPVDASSPAADARQAQMLQKVAETPLGSIATALAAAHTVAPTGRDEFVRERSVFRTNASDSASPVNQSNYTPSASGASGPSALDPVTSTDTYVAEKVAYWISNDVQNAEMKLDGIGDKPVEVSIRMQGNEAHIAFRSDELQARAALENASIHLKEMLQREGLVLSGVSVGTSGTGDSGEQGSKSRQGARQTSVVSIQPARVDGTPGPGRLSGGALDLFV
jgi:flagellar hook-length control protein FliK